VDLCGPEINHAQNLGKVFFSVSEFSDTERIWSFFLWLGGTQSLIFISKLHLSLLSFFSFPLNISSSFLDQILYDTSAKFYSCRRQNLDLFPLFCGFLYMLCSGPDLTNSLVGLLIRFRQDPLAVMGDVQSMFHQVCVPKEDRDLLQFLWWPKEYRMTVHLFGAVSLPNCCNFAMRRNTEDHKHDLSPNVTSTILGNFYVDDCLKSLSSCSTAVKHVADLHKRMLIGGFNLTIWVSNDRQVLESISPEERAKDVKELNLEYDMLPTERALGMSWFVKTDAFIFKRNIKEKPCTRRVILSILSSVYDPLSMAASFVLPAKLLLQER